ncbi:het domain-containing protein [Colletotrichum karsti]|uniref:Het domain-containing protein n=1 Tax=Colletotrichum karsti TaxID=1095194 RepID=A0A9P6LGX2_9PEZI|nr:het domain-containing protein [Colletotrichum karsti]KAF9872641.1 het domain-containing protein [Colletotrichum karsti]
MRLLNVDTRRLEEYFNNIPPYAILSHRWREEEVTLQDLDRPDHKTKKGYVKVDRSCWLAAKHGFQYVWIDTCCIDKTSSAELSEAINSIFRWYADASVCFAFLDDVHTDDSRHVPATQFERSLWFTRGWTLQELLAPKSLRFYSSTWVHFGTRSSLADNIHVATKIPTPFLRGEQDFRTAGIAVRMSWAARRETTRLEDMAYSLLGIFDVNMPLLYGEGERAFERLQLELMNRTPDESILAWSPSLEVLQKKSSDVMFERFRLYWNAIHIMGAGSTGSQEFMQYYRECAYEPSSHGLLARSPKEFACWAGMSATPMGEARSVLEMTSRGLRITLPLFRLEKLAYGLLNCQIGTNFSKVLAIPLFQSSSADEYVRPRIPPCLLDVPWNVTRHMPHHTIFVKKVEQADGPEYPVWNSGFRCGFVRFQIVRGPVELPERLVEVWPAEADKRQWSCVCPLPDRYQNWQRTMLHYSSGRYGADDKYDGFVVVLEPRSFAHALFSLCQVPPPFVCHIVRKPRNQSLKDMMTGLDMSRVSNELVLEDGPRGAVVRRQSFLKHEMFTVEVYGHRFPYFNPVFKRNVYGKVDPDALIRYLTRGLGVGGALSFLAGYVHDSWAFSWREFHFVFMAMSSWGFLSDNVGIADILVSLMLVTVFFALRFKARLAARAIHVSSSDTTDDEVAYRYWHLDLSFVYCFLLANSYVYYRTYRHGEDLSVVLVLQLLYLTSWGQEPRVLQSQSGGLVFKAWEVLRWVLTFSPMLLIPAMLSETEWFRGS